MRRNQRGFALVMAMVLAVLYFGLISLLLADSSRELAAARRFRSRIVAQTLAENAAEGAAAHMLTNPKSYNEENDQGAMHGTIQKAAGGFVIKGTGESIGLEKTSAWVRLQGTIDETTGNVNIDFAWHSQ